MGKRIAKNKIALTKYRKNFVDLLDKLAYRNSRWNVFNDFLELSAVAFSNADMNFLATYEKTWKECEKMSTKTISKYRHEEQQFFPQMLTELTLEFEECYPNYVDVLGEMFHELNFHNEWKGQFFTPQNVSDMTGMCTVDTAIYTKNFFFILS